MLERLVAWFCNNYLGKYLENLNTDQLSVALLQGKKNVVYMHFWLYNFKLATGEVELENVPLKRDILDQLGLPLQIHAGFVGKICFQIPLRKIRSEPWVISFEQLYLVAGPKDKTEVYSWKFSNLIPDLFNYSILVCLALQWGIWRKCVPWT